LHFLTGVRCRSRQRFCGKAWNTVQRAAVLGLAARSEQKHVLQKDGQALTICAEFVRRKGNQCHISLALHLQGDHVGDGLSGVLGHMHINLPPAYATRPGLRSRQEHMEMRRWMRDRSGEVDKKFEELHKTFVEARRPIFAFW